MIPTAISCFTAFLLAAAMTTAALAQERVALVIGNSAYEHAERLSNPANDAAALADTLDSMGFDRVRRAFNLNYGELRRTLGAFARDAAGANIALIYFAGHGIEVGGVNYLIPTDATLDHVDDVEFEAVPLSTVLHALGRASELKLVILDACRNNPFVPEMEVAGATRSIGRGLARVEPGGRDTLVAYAAREGTVAADGSGSNSPYATALIKHIATPAVDVRLVFGRVRDEVLAVTGGKQEPFTYGSLGGAAVVLNADTTATTEGVDDQGTGDAGDVENAQKAWSAIKDTTSAAILEAFMEAYPDTVYSRFARARLEELREQERELAPATTPSEPLQCRRIGADWEQMEHRNGEITSSGAGYVLHGAAWTNGRLENGNIDGNGVISRRSFDFSSGGTVQMQFTVNGAGKYMAIFPQILEGTGGTYISTRNSWAGSPVVPDRKRLFAMAVVEPDGRYLLTVNQDGPDGPGLMRHEGSLKETEARVQLSFADNYAGPKASIALEATEVCLP